VSVFRILRFQNFLVSKGTHFRVAAPALRLWPALTAPAAGPAA
jgi:hypothetical protein